MRDYDPTTGRYVQADPLGLVDGASVYGYALQNPGRYIDPTGLTVGPGHQNYELCKNLEKRMENLRKKIAKRKRELKVNPRKLPENLPGNVPHRKTRAGHRFLIKMDEIQLALLIEEYDRRCNDDDCNGSGTSLPPPVIIPKLPGRGAGGRYSPIVPIGPLQPVPF